MSIYSASLFLVLPPQTAFLAHLLFEALPSHSKTESLSALSQATCIHIACKQTEVPRKLR